jgi:pimeloyl-ACP methyl ester carboxylesterase
VSPALDGSERPVQIAPGYRLSAPGLRGDVRAHPPRPAGTLRDTTEVAAPALDDALRRSNLTEVQRIELDVRPAPRPPGAASVRRAAAGDQLVLEVPDLGPEVEHVVLAVDSDGISTWSFALPAVTERPASRSAAATRRIVIRGPLVAETQPPGEPTARGLLGIAVRRVLKVLVYPVTDAILGPVGERFARNWEYRHRPSQLRLVRPESLAAPADGGIDWATVDDGRILLFLHGTFSTTRAGFGALPFEVVAGLCETYGSRVLAFDHHTLSVDPVENARRFAELVPAGRTVELDIVCHSRGGLVARALATDDPDHVRVRRVVFAGVPNLGTALADADHMTDMLDRLTTILNLFPPASDAAVTDIAEAILTAVKIIGHAVLNGLPGLASMSPSGTFLERLPALPAEVACHGVAADFEPGGGLRHLVRAGADAVLDRVFGKAPNDLVVPTDGVFGDPSAPLVPPDRSLRISANAGIVHTKYFAYPQTVDRLSEWLVTL